MAAGTNGGLATFCVLGPSARGADFIDGVEPNALTTNVGSRISRFPFTAVLSTSFDLPHFVVSPLLAHCVSGQGSSTLLVCAPNRSCVEGQNVVLNLCSHLLPSLFAAAGPGCAEIGIAMRELRHGTIIDAQVIRKIMNVGDAEVTWVAHAGGRAAWDAVMERLGDRYARGGSSAEESAFAVELRMPNGRSLNLVDAGCSPAHLGTLTLVLNSAADVPSDKKTIAPRVGVTFALEGLLPPSGLVHAITLPDAADATYTARVLRFMSELHSSVAPLTTAQLVGGPSSASEDPPTRAALAGTATRASTSSALPPRSPPTGARRPSPAAGTPAESSIPGTDRDGVTDLGADDTAWQDDLADMQGLRALHQRRGPAAGAAPSGRPARYAAADGDHDDSHVSSSSESSNARPLDASDVDVPFTPPPHHRRQADDVTSRMPPNRTDATGTTSPARQGGQLAAAYLNGPRPTSPSAIPRPSPRASRTGHDRAGSDQASAVPSSSRHASSRVVGGDASSRATERELERLRARIVEADREGERARQAAESFEAELQRARRANEELTAALEDASKDKEALRNVAKVSQDEGREMSDLLRKLSARLTELQEASQKHHDETDGLKGAAEDSAREVERLRRELHDAKKTLRLMESRERERVRNAALLRAGGNHVPSPDTRATAGGTSRSSSVKPSRSGSVTTTGGGGVQKDTTARRRVQELTSENAKLHLRVEALTAELNQMRSAVATSAADQAMARVATTPSRGPPSVATTGSVGGDAAAANNEMGALRREVEVLKAQLTASAAELDIANEERSALQRVAVSRGGSRGDASSGDILVRVCQSLLRGLELMLTRLRADVAAANAAVSNANGTATVALRQRQQERASQIAAVEKLKTSIVAVSQKDSVGFIPSAAGENDSASLALVMKAEIERLAHVKALLLPFAQLARQCDRALNSGGPQHSSVISYSAASDNTEEHAPMF